MFSTITNKNFSQMDMFIRKAKLCDISKFAKNWLLQIELDT